MSDSRWKWRFRTRYSLCAKECLTIFIFIPVWWYMGCFVTDSLGEIDSLTSSSFQCNRYFLEWFQTECEGGWWEAQCVQRRRWSPTHGSRHCFEKVRGGGEAGGFGNPAVREDGEVYRRWEKRGEVGIGNWKKSLPHNTIKRMSKQVETRRKWIIQDVLWEWKTKIFY